MSDGHPVYYRPASSPMGILLVTIAFTILPWTVLGVTTWLVNANRRADYECELLVDVVDRATEDDLSLRAFDPTASDEEREAANLRRWADSLEKARSSIVGKRFHGGEFEGRRDDLERVTEIIVRGWRSKADRLEALWKISEKRAKIQARLTASAEGDEMKAIAGIVLHCREHASADCTTVGDYLRSSKFTGVEDDAGLARWTSEITRGRALTIADADLKTKVSAFLDVKKQQVDILREGLGLAGERAAIVGKLENADTDVAMASRSALRLFSGTREFCAQRIPPEQRESAEKQ